MSGTPFSDLLAVAQHLRDELARNGKKYMLLYAYNGTGKTRLSMEFKETGKQVLQTPLVDEDGSALVDDEGNQLVEESRQGDTLYFNAFTEDLFSWDNDLDNDKERVLRFNEKSSFFDGLRELEMDTRIRPYLQRYADFDFKIADDKSEIHFFREILEEGKVPVRVEKIKVSRGEENIFIWCFFLAILQLAMDDDGTGPYSWVKYIYIDDPISSLDEHNAISVAHDLARILKNPESKLKTVISTHHTLFFNVIGNSIGKPNNRFFLSRDGLGGYVMRETGNTPFFHHVASIVDLYEVAESGELYTHHFNKLRTILEKTAHFHGYSKFDACIKQDEDDEDGILHTRLINILSHGNYSLYEPQIMLDENKKYFKKILEGFLDDFPFNPELFPEPAEEAEAP